MKLIELQIEGFKCFKNKTVIPIQDLSVLIGENDSGKSSILRAIELLLNKQLPAEEEYYNSTNKYLDTFSIQGKFQLFDQDNKDQINQYLIDDNIIITKNYYKGDKFKTTIYKQVLQNKLLENYQNLNVEETKALLSSLSLGTFAKQEERKEEIRKYIEANYLKLPKSKKSVSIDFNVVANHLPNFEYYGSHIYGNPLALVKKTLDVIYSNSMYDQSGELKNLTLQKLKEKVLLKLNKSVEQNLLTKIKFYNPAVKKVKGRLDIDFSRGLDFNGLEVDEGHGFKLIDHKGEGSKKRIFLSLLEWDKEIQIKLLRKRSIIRAYDEPDANLHYDAQRKMYNSISEVAYDVKTNIQSIIATHSISMIDRAPATSIIHVLNDNGISEVDYLKSEGEISVKNFINQVSTLSGIKNSSIFYEKCFLLVEGESEEASIPILYQKLFKKTLSERGIVLVNLKSNGAWYNFLKLLRTNKSASTVLLLDSDTQNANSGSVVTKKKLIEIGFDNSFLTNNIFFAGVQEFEDIYSNKTICKSFNKLYPKSKYKKWTSKDINRIRNNNLKISKGLEADALKYISFHKNYFRKPDLSIELALSISNIELKGIKVLSNLFKKIHTIIE